MKHNFKTKVIAAVDPSACSVENLDKLCANGVTAFRLNVFNNSSLDQAKAPEIIRAIGRRRRKFLSILADLPASDLAQKTSKDLKFITDLEIDWIVLPPVNDMEEVRKIKSLINGKVGLISQLNLSETINVYEPIIMVSDAVLISGVKDKNLANVQKDVVNACRRLGRPVIICPWTLESTLSHPIPTKTEISNIRSDIYLGADAIMLPNNFATEKNSLKAIETLCNFIGETESSSSHIKHMENESIMPHKTVVDAICSAANNAAEFSCASAIVLFADSLGVVIRCSRIRPLVPIILVTDSFALASRSGLCNGVYAMVNRRELEIEQMCKVAKSIALEYKFAAIGDNIVVLNSFSENSINICKL
ncbi:MAG: hypothetical protein LBO02_00810 [Holosporaceae bacterium]|jgi:pyruvate kinase|nr:hypothetical protein [Holosporaceae bacterium]